MTLNLQTRTHLSWVERIHDNLEQKLSALTSGGLSPTVDTLTCAPKTNLNLVPGASVPGTDVNISIAPRGTGAFELDVPDLAVTGGICRGDNAVDLQMVRTVATQVASGVDSVIGGGASNTSSGTLSTVSGGSLNTASGINSTIGGGIANTASGLRSTVGGGFSNVASSTETTIGGGVANSATGLNSTVGGGSGNT